MCEAEILMYHGGRGLTCFLSERLASIFNPLMESYFGCSFQSVRPVQVNIKTRAYITLHESVNSHFTGHFTLRLSGDAPGVVVNRSSEKVHQLHFTVKKHFYIFSMSFFAQVKEEEKRKH